MTVVVGVVVVVVGSGGSGCWLLVVVGGWWRCCCCSCCLQKPFPNLVFYTIGALGVGVSQGPKYLPWSFYGPEKSFLRSLAVPL